MHDAAGIPPLDPPYPSATEAWLARAMPRQSPVPPLALFRVFARHLPLAEAMLPLGRWFLTCGGGSGALSVRQRELVILRVTARCGALYEWAVHAASYGDAAALTPAELDATREGDAEAGCWSGAEAALLRAVDALHAQCDIPDALWPELRADFDDVAILEILLLSGWYRAICQLVNAGRVPAEAWAPLPSGPEREAGTERYAP